ncbi:MAG: hypothetical protein KAJ40_07070 [Alphaproteobacteria bacterium]|nr:hypothetical protein [Alphaproteobacteria bacterium]
MKGQPFFFDANIFDEDTPLSEEERSKLPEFSHTEMEDARKQAYEEGKSAGLQESMESMTHTMLSLLKKIEQDIGILYASEGKRQKEYEQNATNFAAQIFAKAFPVYMRAHGVDELRAAVTEALSENMVPETVQIEINDAVFGPLSKLLEEHVETLQKQVTFKATPSLPEYACRINWPGGGLLCDRSALTRKIFDILNQSLAQHGFNIHDEANNSNMEDFKKKDTMDEAVSPPASVEEESMSGKQKEPIETTTHEES